MKILVKPLYLFKGPGLSRQSSQLHKKPATELIVEGSIQNVYPEKRQHQHFASLKYGYWLSEWIPT